MLELRTQLKERLSGLGRLVTEYFQRSPTHTRVRQLLVTLDRHNSLGTASAMAFDLFLAIIPMLGLAGTLASLLLHSQPRALVESSRVLDLAPARLHGFLVRNMDAFTETEVAPLFVLLVLWLSSSAFVTMIRVFEESFDCQKRSWLKARLLALGFAALGLVLFVAATAAGALMTWHGMVSEESERKLSSFWALIPRALREFELLPTFAFLASSLGIAVYLALIYRFAVIRKVKRRFVPGALVATTIGLLGSFLLAYYVTNLGRYALFYGSLAVIVVVMLWLWLWCSAILIGAEINVALEDTLAIASRPPSEREQEEAAQGAGIEPAGPMQTPSIVGKADGD